jgi:hypothetical protein
LLRDLHRVETDFQFLLVPPDLTELQPVLVPSEARAAMRQHLEITTDHSLAEARAELDAGRRDLAQSWPDWLKTATLTQRRYSPSEDR